MYITSELYSFVLCFFNDSKLVDSASLIALQLYRDLQSRFFNI